MTFLLPFLLHEPKKFLWWNDLMAHIFQLPLPSKHFCPGRIISPDSTIDEVSLLYTSLLLFGSRPILKPSSCCCWAVVLLLCVFHVPEIGLGSKTWISHSRIRQTSSSFIQRIICREVCNLVQFSTSYKSTPTTTSIWILVLWKCCVACRKERSGWLWKFH